MRLEDWRWMHSPANNSKLSLLVLLLSLSAAHAALEILLTQAPSLITSNTTASFRFTLDENGRDPCTNSSCSILCKVDQAPSRDCSTGQVSFSGLRDGRHEFQVRVNTSAGITSSAQLSWTVDTIPPTASVVAERAYTNQLNVTVHILFSEPCNGSGGFSCNISSCDLKVSKPGTVVFPTLKASRPNVEYSLVISVSPTVTKAQILLTLDDNICSDGAGNMFRRTENSTFLVHIDRTEVFVNVWTPIVDSQVVIDNQPRTVQATNRTEDLRVFLDFTEPVVNTTQELALALHSSDGLFQPTHRKSRGNRRFAFLLTNVSDDTVITVSFDSNRIVSRSGAHVQPVDPVSFIFDQVSPKPTLTTTSPPKTKDRSLPVLVQFPEPVFQFDASAFSVTGGTVSDFKEVSKSTYLAKVAMFPGDALVSALVLANTTADISGNGNLASNLLRVRHYDVPVVAEALFAFSTASFLATVFASGALFVSTSTLAATGAISSRTFGCILAEPSQNFMGMTGHLQVFALSDWLAVSLPVEYRETVRGFRWVIPHLRTPWESKRSSSPLTGSSLDASAAPSMVKERWRRLQSSETCRNSLTTTCQESFYRIRGRKLGSNSSVYGPPLDSTEYLRYFKNQTKEPGFREEYTGWDDFARNMFWLGVFLGALGLLHLLVILVLRLRTGTFKAALTFPRFELLLLILSLPCISQACAFLIRGGRTKGIVVGVLFLAVPVGVLLCVTLFLVVAVLSGAFVEFQQVVLVNQPLSWRQKLLRLLAGEKVLGRWVRKEGVASTFVPRYGLLFEDRKGPPRLLFVHGEQEVLRWEESGSGGIGRMRALSSDDETQQTSSFTKAVGAVRTLYVLADFSRRIALGVLFGAYPRSHRSVSQVITVLSLSAGQLLLLITCKPYVRRGVQVAEAVSLACEAGVFAIALALFRSSSLDNNKALGGVMLAFFFISFIGQLVNQWYALAGLVLQLSPTTREASFKASLKRFWLGLLLPILPRRYWSRFVNPREHMPRTGLTPVVHSSPSPDLQRQLAPTSPIVVAETGVPYDAGSPSQVDPRARSAARQAGDPRAVSVLEEQTTVRGMEVQKPPWKQWIRSWSSPRPETKEASDLEVLRELARASFPRSKTEGTTAVQRALETHTESSETTSSSSNEALG